MDTPLHDTTTVVTGASSGIGSAIAARFAAAGSRLVLAARRRDKLERLMDELREQGAEAMAVPTDVTDYQQVTELIERAEGAYGSVDIMINNAGYAVNRPLLESTVEEIDGQVDANLKGVIYGCRACLPGMVARKRGHVINIGSICSLNHYPDYGAYVGAKFGVLGFTRSVYEEVRAHGVRMNVLSPAAVNTAWADIAGAAIATPRDDRLQPEDLAEAAFFCVTMPKRVQIENIVLWPTAQPTC